jgi:hypothetical protein
LFGWTENFNTQAPEHCHIDFVKEVAECTNNKDVFLTVLRYHVRDGMIRDARSLELAVDRNDSISCDLGIRYPTFQSIMSGKRNHLSLHVRYRM